MSGAEKLRIVNSEEQTQNLFRRLREVNQLIPDDQEVVSVRPTTTVAEALDLMREQRFSQIPVMEGNLVLGVFSYRSFSHGVAMMGKERESPAQLPVDEFMEEALFATIHDEIGAILDKLDHNDALVVGDPELCQGMLTPMDALRYLYELTHAFVLLEEIELLIRRLIAMALDAEELQECIQNSLKHLEKPPKRLEDMTFDNYLQVVRDGRNWDRFKPVFGGTRERFRARFEPIRDLRNDVFHFKREITIEDHQRLADCRNWLLMKARAADARSEEDSNA